MWARIENGVVAEITDVDPAGRFHQSIQWEKFDGRTSVEVGWIYLDGTFSEPDEPHKTLDDLRADVAARRYQAETGGTNVNGMQVNTDRESQALMTGAAVSAMLDSGYSVRWKTADGFVLLNAEQLIGLSSAVRAHVQACFDREAELLGAIVDGTYTAALLEEGWPNEQVPGPAAG